MSLGVASFPKDAVVQNDLIHLADVAVYQAKLQGRNCVVCASDVPRAITLDTSQVESAEVTYRAAYVAHTSTAAAVPPPALRSCLPRFHHRGTWMTIASIAATPSVDRRDEQSGHFTFVKQCHQSNQ